MQEKRGESYWKSNIICTCRRKEGSLIEKRKSLNFCVFRRQTKSHSSTMLYSRDCPGLKHDGNCKIDMLIPWKWDLTIVHWAFRSILSFAITVKMPFLILSGTKQYLFRISFMFLYQSFFVERKIYTASTIYFMLSEWQLRFSTMDSDTRLFWLWRFGADITTNYSVFILSFFFFFIYSPCSLE